MTASRRTLFIEECIPFAERALLAECVAPARDLLGEELVREIEESWATGAPLNEEAQESLLSRVEGWMAEASRIAIGYKKARDTMALWTLVVTGFGLFLTLLMSTVAASFTGAVLVYVGIIGSVIAIICGLLNAVKAAQDFIAKREELKVEGAALKKQLEAVRPKLSDPELVAKVSALADKLGSVFTFSS